MSAGPVFVTGGSGMLGRRVIAALVADGRTVRALARSGRSSAAVAAAGAKPILGDLADLDAVRAGRTVVYDLYGQPHGDASLFPLVAGDHLAETRAMPRPGLEGLGVWLGLLGLLLIGRGSRRGLAP